MVGEGTVAQRAPWHVWVVGVISLLWNSYGCYDYTMTKLDPAHYLAGSGMSAAGQAYMLALPAWVTAFWALGVWGSLAGSLLLLARSRHAVTAFAASLVGLASWVVLYSFSPWLLLLPVVTMLVDLIADGSFTRGKNWYAVKIADLLRGKVGGL